ncbi:MAG: hypothetical protein P8176_12890, partial [Gammaproteobacteria bacterium]
MILILYASLFLFFNAIGVYLWSSSGDMWVFGVFAISFAIFLATATVTYALLCDQFQTNKTKTVPLPLLGNRYLFLGFVIILLMLSTFYFRNGIPAFAGDDADYFRFQLQNKPGNGFLFRITYWMLAPATALLLELTARDTSRRFSTLCWLCVLYAFSLTIFCGSKAAAVHFIGLHYFWFIIRKKKARLKLLPLLKLGTILTCSLLISAWLAASYTGKSISSGIEQIGDRLTRGAGEGFYKALSNFIPEHGLGEGHYTFQKPLYTLGGTFRIIEKSDLTQDTGIVLAVPYRGPQNLACFTFTRPGLGYIDFGLTGAYLYSLIAGLGTALATFLALSAKPWVLSRCALIFTWAFTHLLDWGFIDGWIAYCFIYLLVLFCTIIILSRRKFTIFPPAKNQ